MVFPSDYDSGCKKTIFFVCVIILLIIGSCEAVGTFGFDIHHRSSEPVKRIFGFDGLPEKGSPEYYSAMAHRDRVVRGRHLSVNTPTPVTFADGNHTLRIDDLAYLYYANVSIGTPGVWFLVALDTGSDLFWLPCDCQHCAGAFVTISGKEIHLNAYHPNASSTSKVVSCKSTSCDAQWACSPKYACVYEVRYLSNGTSSAGILYDDVLHLATENSDRTVDAPILVGCGFIQTGGFLNSGAPNGLFGLGMDHISVPSVLANQGITSNSFSMCFGQDGLGRIVFGDKGRLDQAKTPFNVDQTRLTYNTYNISLTHIAVDENITKLSMTAVFDSGTSFTYVNDAAYSVIVENFNSRIKQPRHPSDPLLPFEYCYDFSGFQTRIEAPLMNLTMKGGSRFFVKMPFEILTTMEGGYVHCLGIFKSDVINIIGQNFMTGYRIVFDREEMVLGWRPSDWTFGFDIHHRSSEPVKRIFGFDGLPEKGSPEYYSAMAHRDRVVRGRHLSVHTPTPVTFADGNHTLRIDDLAYLYYANVSIGTPGVWFLVALDTGSNLFWLPCDCQHCAGAFVTISGKEIHLNAYHHNASSTSKVVSCKSTRCDAQWACSPKYACVYEVRYLSNGTSSAGILYDDVLHLATENSDRTVDAPIIVGCGLIQTGGFLNSGAPNGLFGLGMDHISVPSVLANQGIASNSFSMCFGQDGLGRIVFGDKGRLDQAKTPFNVDQTGLTYNTYNINLTHIAVDENITKLSMTAVFDSGTSFTYVNDAAYSVIVENFNSRIKQPRHPSDPLLLFEYCYDFSGFQTRIEAPLMNLTMKGGSRFFVKMPFEILTTTEGGFVHCLGIFKSDVINIIGQNFMTGYRIVFDREEMVLGWRPSDCNDAVDNGNRSTNSTRAPSPSTVLPPPIPSPPGKGMAPKSLNSVTPELLIFVFVSLWFLLSLFTHFEQ